MRRYLISCPAFADFITWGDTPEAAIAAARDLTGHPMKDATAAPFNGLADLPLSQHLAHPPLVNPPTTDEE